jgi:hypothetical protein
VTAVTVFGLFPTLMFVPPVGAGRTLTKLYEILFEHEGSLGMIQSSENIS